MHFRHIDSSFCVLILAHYLHNTCNATSSSSSCKSSKQWVMDMWLWYTIKLQKLWIMPQITWQKSQTNPMSWCLCSRQACLVSFVRSYEDQLCILVCVIVPINRHLLLLVQQNCVAWLTTLQVSKSHDASIRWQYQHLCIEHTDSFCLLS